MRSRVRTPPGPPYLLLNQRNETTKNLVRGRHPINVTIACDHFLDFGNSGKGKLYCLSLQVNAPPRCGNAAVACYLGKREGIDPGFCRISRCRLSQTVRLEWLDVGSV